VETRVLQELVKTVFSDQKTREQFMSDPNSVISRFDLTDREQEAVLATHMKLGLVAAESAQLETAVNTTSLWTAPIP